MKTEPTKGFLLVASTRPRFFDLAINAINSIRDNYPDAKVCLVTEEAFCDGRESIADHLIYCSNHVREKLWALDKTPFDITMYIDADVEIIHEDIEFAFDQLKGNDIAFVDLPVDKDSLFAIRKWPGGEMKLCGGIVLYDIRKPIVQSFMKMWNEYYRNQFAGNWWPAYKDGKKDFDLHPEVLRQFDQFTLWFLTEEHPYYKDLKVGVFEDGERWNWYMRYEVKGFTKPEKGVIIQHYSGLLEIKDDRY
jgi:hypothetical protein